MLEEFKKFALRGPVLDLAIGVIIGAAFGKIVTSLVNDILMPPIGVVTGGVDFTNLFLDLSGQGYDSVVAAREAGAATINYGIFLNTIIEFTIVAFALFVFVRQVNRLRAPKESAPVQEKDCPHCLKKVHVRATRCPFCTSPLSA